MKLDLYATHKAEYVTPKKPVIVDIGPATYLSIEGTGDPGGEEFQTAVGALYSLAFTIKMASKFAGTDYAVSKLEGFYDSFGAGNWKWRLVIRTPDFITAKELKQAQETLLAKGKGNHVTRVKLQKVREGRCVQMLHVGPYTDEERTISQMLAAAAEQKLDCSGAHHEIYLNDPRRVAPEKIRTILRLPVRRA